MQHSFLKLTLLVLLVSCKGYKIIVDSKAKSLISTIENSGSNYYIIRNDSFNIPNAKSKIVAGYTSVKEQLMYAKLDLPTLPIEGCKQLSINSDSIYKLPVLKHDDIFFEFSFRDLLNYPKAFDVRTWLLACPPWIFGMITTPFYIKKNDPYLIGCLKVYTADGELLSIYENYQTFTFKMRGSACCFEAKEFIYKGMEGLKNKLIKQFQLDTSTNNFIIAKQKFLSMKSISDLNLLFYKNYYSNLLLQLENNSKKAYDEMKIGLLTEFKKGLSSDEEENLPIAFNQYSSLKATRLLNEQGNEEAVKFLKSSNQEFDDFFQKYSFSKERIVENRERRSMIFGTIALSLQQASNIHNTLGTGQPSTTQYLQIFTTTLQRNIAINYPHLNVNPNSPSLFLSISQAATNDNLDNNSFCDDAQKTLCSKQAANDPNYQSWNMMLTNNPGEYYALHAAIARSQATMNYCGACLTKQQKAAIQKVLDDCTRRLSLLSSDKYISAIKHNYVQSIRPPGYGVQTASQPLTQKSNCKTKVSTKAN